MPPGTAEQRHLHHRARQFFYVLAGEFTMELEDHLHRLTAGQGLEIVPGATHQARNESSADVRFLVISSPPSHGDREPAPASNSFLPERCAAGDEGATQRPGIDVSLKGFG
ncbi:cupin domain-containing protein [Silvibacterium dinghuense]|uniref:Cupin domain-containing protein n=2 Tax=Silvibacterium dinghuense TaxID=1560006 RepID=A0A4Q1SKE6_9BACT|nr:cupin domain-containing protein [Silvibacterium dinghuense]